jgi:hypothetical protein
MTSRLKQKNRAMATFGTNCLKLIKTEAPILELLKIAGTLMI